MVGDYGKLSPVIEGNYKIINITKFTHITPPSGAIFPVLSVPLLYPSGGLAGRWRRTRPLYRSSLLVFFKVWFSSGIGEMVATIMFWNKVSPAFFYLDNVRSDVDKGEVGVSSTRSEGYLQIFAVGRCWIPCCRQGNDGNIDCS